MTTNKQEKDSTLISNREMTITHADFMRILPKALGSDEYTVKDREIHYVGDTWGMTIKLSVEQQWGIGALTLPRLQVHIAINGCNESEAKAVLKRFDQCYQRGGG